MQWMIQMWTGGNILRKIVAKSENAWNNLLRQVLMMRMSSREMFRNNVPFLF